MNFRYKFSIVLLMLGLLSAIMSFSGKNTGSVSPEEILSRLVKADFALTADELAGMVVEQDSGLQIIDIRNPGNYKNGSIPGAINIPLSDLFGPAWETLAASESVRTVFYDDKAELSIQALILSMQKGYTNVFILKGGMAEWDSLVMKSAFSGDKITAEENSLFEKRYKARRLFTSWNSMSDSLKSTFFAVKQKKDKELVGGCE